MTADELARAAGVWLETLRLFEQRGLLTPPPDGRYDDDHLEIVRFVTRMQAEHRLELDVIGDALSEAGFSPARAEDSLAVLVQPDPTRAGPGPVSRGALAAQTGVDDALLDQLAAAGLVPAAGPYAGHHVWVVEAAMELVASGLAAERVVQLGGIGMEIAEAEVDAVITHVGRGAAFADAMDETRERRMAVGRLVSSARHAASRELMARLARAGNSGHTLVMESIHVPSGLFMTRYRMDAALSDLQTAADAVRYDEDGPAALYEHGRLLLGVGRFEQAAAELEAAVARMPKDASAAAAWGTLALARAIVGETQKSLNAVDTACEVAPGSPRALAFRAVVLAMAAAAAGDLLLATARVHESLKAVSDSREATTDDPGEALEALLVRGRLCTVMPAAFGLRERGMEELRAVLDATDEGADEAALGLEVPGARDLVRLNALFYLGLALSEAGDPEAAAPHLSEVVALDPVSAYATRAWQQLNR